MNPNYKKWTAKEEQQLMSEVKLGMTGRLIAERHGRTLRSVYKKIHKLRNQAAKQPERRQSARSKAMPHVAEPAKISFTTETYTSYPDVPRELPATDPGLKEINQMLFALTAMVFVIAMVVVAQVFVGLDGLINK